ncbi:hypothetical protein HUE56_15105 [Azospirillum oryzae]|uniref:Helix-turn-helix domain-containing protein n=1 Tax=Azospirillum oryzae TaxID=286727 RepID=A0A6N1AKX1_9PROT|nr:hypothetical protein [Azospirillum oryzae]KAA0589939.1 hypothetical protein FZ938_10105 [Azospirillum oryzae]QKS51778.1 hypothetical protein HUE56_15105 [Azospirillum oryzae]GLR81405.1 hypothetical protein GCM10007856_40910 [Azospirillum oryzae]
MSGKLSFRERPEQQESSGVRSPAPSGSTVRVVLRLGGAVDHPVTLIQTLARCGLVLRKAHGVVTRLVAGEKLPVLLADAPEPAEVISTLERLGVAVGFPHPPVSIDVKAIRAKLGLIQRKFAARFRFNVDSVQNWEQSRYVPDPPTRILLKVIEQHPEAVEDVLGSRVADDMVVAGRPRLELAAEPMGWYGRPGVGEDTGRFNSGRVPREPAALPQLHWRRRATSGRSQRLR